MIDEELLSTETQQIELRQQLIAAAKQFYSLGWMAGTAGNLSARMSDGSFWITASGRAKGELSEGDFVRIFTDGGVEPASPDSRPSAETSIHQAIYALFPEANACFHVHSIEANLVSNFVREDNLPLPPLEMLKGLGLWVENPQCFMPLFDNHLHVPNIAREISDRFQIEKPQIPALLIRNHGVTVWADSTATARNYIELVEYIFRYMVSARQAGF